MEDKKIKKWNKPELIILVRNQPEESVLDSCKTSTGHTPGPAGKLCSDYNGNGCSRHNSS